ncbi:MAG: glycosyl transferase family protein [Antarcticimicrobium sp.]|uniref:glycosyl transferase family protein n=1 Tax=Antarcticimicrobium sp. TaxID=2824147 RepID=UPI0026159171|nr:glycosyl transferase family protein [Antarcticimicrobium sp.]MDF1715459.1 glycosyl transferase family protein [Antarcticimicrobium sp.]
MLHDPLKPHPFSRFVAILGRGKTKQRPLTFDEAREAMQMILDGAVLPEQIGAFLMLLRLKEEAPEEIAGFAQATRDRLPRPDTLPRVDLDWSSYAGKRIQLPWFVLSVMVLVGQGTRVVVHGTEGHTPGRLYTRQVFELLGLPVASDLAQAAAQVEAAGITYVPLEAMSPVLRHLIELRLVFGLRSPVHSFTRMINPFDAPVMMQGIFHRGFMDIHAGAARLLNQPRAAVFRGEGGEIERRPNKPTQVWSTQGDAEPLVETWPALLDDAHQPADAAMDPARLRAVWSGADSEPYAIASVVGTLAVTLRSMGRAGSVTEAEAQARALWEARDRTLLEPR